MYYLFTQTLGITILSSLLFFIAGLLIYKYFFAGKNSQEEYNTHQDLQQNIQNLVDSVEAINKNLSELESQYQQGMKESIPVKEKPSKEQVPKPKVKAKAKKEKEKEKARQEILPGEHYELSKVFGIGPIHEGILNQEFEIYSLEDLSKIPSQTNHEINKRLFSESKNEVDWKERARNTLKIVLQEEKEESDQEKAA